MSVIADNVFEVLNNLFPPKPYPRIKREVFVSYKGQKLYFDFYIKKLLIFFECQGEQHVKFVKYFHIDTAGFEFQKHRDNLKIEYVQENGLYLVRLYEYEKITEELILNKMNNAFDSEYNFCE
jgi:hypothetical protein